MATLQSARADAVRALRAFLTVEDDRERRTPFLRDLAEALVEIRAHFLTEEGLPDWGGRSYAYRMTVGEVLGEANVPPGERSRIMSAVRWHVGKALRERLDAETLESLGMKATSPAERGKVQRAKRSAILQALRGGDAETLVGIDGLRALAGSLALLERVDPSSLAGLPPEQDKAVETLLDGLTRRVRALVRARTAGKG